MISNEFEIELHPLRWSLGLVIIKFVGVRIEPLKVWHDVTNLEFVIYLMIF